MKRYDSIICLFAIAILTLQTIGINAQSTADKVYQAYIQKDAATLEAMVKALQQQVNKNDLAQCDELLDAQFFLLNATIAAKDEDTFDNYIDEAIKNATQLSKKEKYQVKATALMSAMYGFKIAFSPMKGMFLGSKASDLAAKGKDLDEKSPIAWAKYGNNLYNTPEMWGGDKAKALQAYEKAVKLFEQTPGLTTQNPYYLDALAWLGIAYKNAGNTAAAQQVFTTALQVEPSFAWVKNDLLPSLQ